MDSTINYDYKPEMVESLPITELAQFVIAAQGKPENTEVSISFVDDEEMTRLNEGYRGKQGPTDVLSFECDNLDDGFDEGIPENVPYELGDIVIAVDVCDAQAPLYGNTFQQEVEMLLIHGLLHLSGYDHIEDDEAEIMEAREQVLLDEWRARS